MSRIHVLIALALLAAGCARSHGVPDPDLSADASTRADGGAPAAADPGEPASPASPVSCGPNVCYDGDICCDALCGQCTAPGACHPERSCTAFLRCGGSCEGGLCCPSCEGDGVCVEDRDECPPLECD